MSITEAQTFDRTETSDWCDSGHHIHCHSLDCDCKCHRNGGNELI